MRGNSARLGGIAMRRIWSVAFAATMLAGCVTTDRVSFRPTAPTQMALFRDGRAVMASTGTATRVVISPKPRQQQRAQRPVFIVAIQNGSAQPVNFTLAGVTAELSASGTSRPLQVIGYEQLVQEARAEAVAGLIIGVALIGAGAAVAGSSGSYSNAVLAGSLAGAGVGTMVGSAERSEEAIARFEETVMKDHTVMPGEWFGGQMHIQAPSDIPADQIANYRLTIRLGPDAHVFDVVQTPGRQ